MVYLFRKIEQDEGAVIEKISEYPNALSWTPTFVEWQNGKYRAKQYCAPELGEYFTADPDGKQHDQEANADVDDILNYLNSLDVEGGEET